MTFSCSSAGGFFSRLSLRILTLLALLCPATLVAQEATIRSVYAVAKQDLPKKYEAIEVVSFNVGNAGDDIFNLIAGNNCYEFKLCRKATASAVQNWLEQTSPDVLLLQETQGREQVLGTENGGPLLDKNTYDAYCDKFTCVAWKKQVFKLAKERNCDFYPHHHGGLVVCPLQRKKSVIQFASVYLPAISIFSPPMFEKQKLKYKLIETLFRGQDKMIDPSAPLLIGGDFNTQLCTNGRDCRMPYPKNFYTLFGQHQKGYGAYHELLAGLKPPHSFFGAYQGGAPNSFVSQKAYWIKNSIDHVFANFGIPVDDVSSYNCIYSSCIMGGGLDFPNGQGEPIALDHRAVFTRVATKFE